MQELFTHLAEFAHFREVMVFLVASVVIVPLFSRLRASPVLGYLVAGVVVGPHGVGLVSDVDGVKTLAELGVVFLLFAIGLELSVKRLITMRRYVFGIGTVQVGMSAAAIGLIAYGVGQSGEASLIIGAALALSSTAIVLQILIERGELAARHGRVSFAILLMQDLAVVPLLVLVAQLTDPGQGGLGVAMGLAAVKAAIAVAAIILIGRLILRPFFRIVAGTRNSELFTATVLLVILGTAIGTALVGLSMALGAFLAGLMLAGSEYRHQIEADIQPFRGLLLGLFFIAVGMEIDVALLMSSAGVIIAMVAGLFAVKALLVALVCVLFAIPRYTAFRVALMLAQGGEFGFILLGLAMAGGVVPGEIGQKMMLVIGMSMALTPFLAILGKRLVAPFEQRQAAQGLGAIAEETADLEQHFLVAGYGRVGQTVARMLTRYEVPFVALDLSPDNVREGRAAEMPVFYGDTVRPEVLRAAGIDRARALVITLNDPQQVSRMVEVLRKHWPALAIYVRARDRRHGEALSRAGATAVVPEIFEASLQLAGAVLRLADVPDAEVERAVDEARRESLGGERKAEGGS